MRTDTPKTIYLKDYRPSPYQIEHVDLLFPSLALIICHKKEYDQIKWI